ncbi:MAG: DUF3021 domain-containing protein [Lachnospiraceae bacterium]|nr:DUF3021 domain-containing protein [Lachnospiraceae bacterium]
MNRVLKKGLILGAVGFVMGIIIGVVIFTMTGGREITPVSIFHFLVGGIYAAWAMGGSTMYDIESWSILRCTLTHFITTLLAFYLMGTIQDGWLVIGSSLFWIVTAAFVVAYIIIWLAQYFSYKRKVKRMNEELRAFREKKD